MRLLNRIKLLNASIIGLWMIFDGIYVINNGHYFGSEKPGPWVNLVRFLGIDPYSLGYFFITLGLIWCLIGVLQQWDETQFDKYELFITIFTLFYAVIGTIFALLYLFLIFKTRQNNVHNN